MWTKFVEEKRKLQTTIQVKRSGRIVDFGVFFVRGSVEFVRVRKNPRRGQYACDEIHGNYMFSRADRDRMAIINYTSEG